MNKEELEQYMKQVNENEDTAIKLLNKCVELSEKVEELETLVENQRIDIEHLEKTIEDLEQDRDENYRPIPVSEQVGINDKDFY